MSSESESENPTVTDEELSREIKNQLEAAHYKDLTLRTVRKSLEDKFKIEYALPDPSPSVVSSTESHLSKLRLPDTSRSTETRLRRRSPPSPPSAPPSPLTRKLSPLSPSERLVS